MASPSLPTLPNRLIGQGDKDARGREDKISSGPPFLDLVVATFGDPVGQDYAEFASTQTLAGCNSRFANLSDPSAVSDLQATVGCGSVASIVVFLHATPTENLRHDLDRLLALAATWQTEFIGIVSTYQVHLGNSSAAETEAHVVDRVKVLHARTVVFRPGHVLSRNSWASSRLRRFGFSYPLWPKRFRGCCVNGDELFAALEDVRLGPSRIEQGAAVNDRQETGTSLLTGNHSMQPAPRVYTLLGPNKPWRQWLARQRATGPLPTCLLVGSALLSLLFVGHLAGFVFSILAWRRPTLRGWNFETLCPGSFRELLDIYNKYNYRHVKVVGYNNGVIHFGQRFPGKTVISTVRCNRVVMAGAELVKADCGATVRKALDFLAASGKELPVVPNYSYVCLGTSFFVPIHGSAADFSTIADTIDRVVFYDPARDQIITATRDEREFQQQVYNLKSDVLLLRLYLRVKPKSQYFVHKVVQQNPSGANLLTALRDNLATNVEIRKSRASTDEVTVSTYYKDFRESSGPLLELPRDTLGRLWDRLEENAVTSFLMHALTRHFAYHLELFFTAEDFVVFWETHRTLPLRKLQMRYIRRDGLPHSAFRDHDCVAVDLFMLRRHRRQFKAYLKKSFAFVRTNPGKHGR